MTEREDGWVEWSGGPNPVPGAMVDVRLRDGTLGTNCRSHVFAWGHPGSAGDIIAYRVTPSSDGGSLPASPSIPTEQAETPVVGWQPIETAPVEDRVLIFRPSIFEEDRIFLASLDGEGWWTVHDGKHDHNLRGADPTHWMPLPAPPITPPEAKS